MNTIPDEVLLALWLDDELEGEEFAKVESWALTQPDQLAAREEVRAWRKTMSTTIPAVEEPPYSDFFNHRIEKEIRALQLPVAQPVPIAKPSFWRWIFPATAFAGMALAFWVGTMTHPDTSGGLVAKRDDSGSLPAWYTPEQGVDAKWAKSKDASSSVIVLQGVSAIPDTLDFTETAMYQFPKEFDSTAGAESPRPANLSR